MARAMNIVIDLDGTLIDSRERLYRLYRHLTPATTLGFDDYWLRKREGVSNEALLAEEPGFDPARVAGFVTDWMRLIESPEYLAFDRPFDGSAEALATLARDATLHLCTDRQDRAAAIAQLRRMGLLDRFASVLVTERRATKRSLLEAQLPMRDFQDWFVADTGVDLEMARALQMKTCAVLSGFRSRAYLERYAPDRIVDGIVDFRP